MVLLQRRRIEGESKVQIAVVSFKTRPPYTNHEQCRTIPSFFRWILTLYLLSDDCNRILMRDANSNALRTGHFSCKLFAGSGAYQGQ